MTSKAGGPATPEPELRQLTVFFCDLVGSTPLAQVMEAEDYHDLIQEYQRTVNTVIARFEGEVARTFGDGILVLFGHPIAHEDDAERAVRAACETLRAIKAVNQSRSGAHPLNVRIGIHTGPAVVSKAGAGDEIQAVGESVNLAARLQGMADPDTTVISAATLKLVSGLFVTRDLGDQALKGIQQAVQVHQVLAETGARGRLEAAEQLTPFVGRRQELDLLAERWSRAAAGHGQAVLLSAEPGMGKSRLLLTLREQIDGSAPWLECRCSPLERNTAFAPVIDLLNRVLDTPQGASNDIRLDALERSIDAAGQKVADAVPLLAPLLNVKLPAKYPAVQYSLKLKHKKTVEALGRWCLGRAGKAPSMMVLEDLHWADPSTVDLLGMLVEQVPSRPMMLLPSARPEFQPVWGLRPHLALLTLDPLGSDDTGSLLNSITGNRALPVPVRERLMKQTGGVPLFLEEATRALLESGQLVEADGRFELNGQLDRLSIPPTLQDTLTARLDRLGEAKALIQLCAVIGREIPFGLLRRVAEIDETALQEQLHALVNAQLLYVRGSNSGPTYQFKHALIQDASYNSIWKRTRARLHERIAAALEQHFPQIAKANPELLAGHFEGAGNIRSAIGYRKAAGRLAARSSFTEATEHARKALKLVAALPEGDERLALELDVNLTLADIVSAAGVVGSADPDAVYARLRELCATVKDPGLVGRALSASWVAHYQRCDYQTTLDMGAQLLDIGAQLKRGGIQIVGWIARGLAHFSRGEQRQALEAVRNAEMLTDAARESAESHVAYDLILPRLYIELLGLALTGSPDRALRIARDMVVRADALRHPFLMVFARLKGSSVDLIRRDWPTLLASTPQTLRIAEDIGDQDHISDSHWIHAVALCQVGRFDEGLPEYRQVIEHELRWQAPHWHSFVHGNIADALLRAGRVDEARAALDAGVEMMERCNERFWEADLHRVRGELLRVEGAAPAAIQEAFDRGLAVARAQDVKLLELRVASSLAKFWCDSGRAADARALLAPVRAGFTEGFALEDLTVADALLASL